MIRAATVSILRVLRMRRSGRPGSSSAPPRTSGIMPTPVSKPESPRASCGKTRSDAPSISRGLP